MVVNFMAMAHILLSMQATLLVTATASQIQMERSLCTSAEFWLGTPTWTTSTDLYDSGVDKTPNPTMFVVFHATQAYPEYLITFK